MQATLVAAPSRSLSSSYPAQEFVSSVPTPFPRELLPPLSPVYTFNRSTPPPPELVVNGQSIVPDLPQHLVAAAEAVNSEPAVVRTVTPEPVPEARTDLQPSLEDLRESCLSALLNLFPKPAVASRPTDLFSSVPPRRHSVPISPGAGMSSDGLLDDATPPAPLQQLLCNLRMQDPLRLPDGAETPVYELARRLPAAAEATLDGLAAELARSLGSLLVNIERLCAVPGKQQVLQSRSSFRKSLPVPHSTDSEQDLYETLGRHVLSVKAQHLHRTHSMRDASAGLSETDPTQALWEDINKDMETILRLCRERTPSPSFAGHHGPDASPVTPNLVTLQAPTQSNYFDNLPPEYDYQDYPQELPMYDDEEKLANGPREKRRSTEKSRDVEQPFARPDIRISSEKMRIDLESITSAIDRLYLVAPQLHNQRVELKRSKLDQMELARLNGTRLRNATSESALELETGKLVGRGRITNQTAEPSKRFSADGLARKFDLKGKGKVREKDSREALQSKSDDLDQILRLIGKSTGDQRRIADQRVDLGDFQTRMEKARVVDRKQKERLVEQLVQHSGAGRLSTQDAVFKRDALRSSMASTQESEGLLSLPEFIRESVPPASLSRSLNPNTLMTLPEFFREQFEQEGRPSKAATLAQATSTSMRVSATTTHTHNPVSLIKKIARSRSNSAPPLSLSWFKSSGAAASKLADSQRSTPTPSPPTTRDVSSATSARPSFSEDPLQILYVAEYHQNLHSVQVFLRVVSRTPGLHVEMEVLTSEDSALMGGNTFVVRAGDIQSTPFSLPVPVIVGHQNLKVSGEHFEIKLDVPPLAQVPVVDLSNGPRLLDSAQINEMEPSSFVCSSCSLPVVQCSKITEYRDLPSEHWAEMIDAWMCHADQKLTGSLTQHSNGAFAPVKGQAFVGGSYILFDESVVVKESLSQSMNSHAQGQGDHCKVRCRCGAIIGRVQQSKGNGGGSAYRLAKYALRPASPSLEPFKIPLSAFVVADMVELQQAHATHRFVVTDDEEDKPRILLWLFNPTVRLSYASATHYALPEETNIHAAKVFYALIGPSSSLAANPSRINEQYPAFKGAETISYPMTVCRRLAAMLKESTELYPASRKSMMQLDVGWLQRG